jgi:hypothetical protein
MEPKQIYYPSGKLTHEGRDPQEFADLEVTRIFNELKDRGYSNPDISLALYRAVSDAQTNDIVDFTLSISVG